MKFLLMDETLNDETDFPLSSLTGLIVSPDRYSCVRTGVYAAIAQEIQPAPNRINLQPPELHLREFLKDRPDEYKFEVLQRLVDTVKNCGVQVIRVGYYVTPLLRDQFEADPNLTGLCWFTMTLVLEPVLREELLVPVRDAGFNQSFQPTVKRLSGLVQDTDIMRAAGLGQNLSIQASENLAEVVYSDSRYSALTQLTDVVAGPRRVCETVRETGRQPEATFKQRLLAISAGLQPATLYERAIAMCLNGAIQGPKLAAPPPRSVP